MVAALIVCFSLATAQVTRGDRITVYLAAPTRDGFVDTNKDIQDSIKDVRDRLSGMRELLVVSSREKADIVLTIVTRGVGSEAYGSRLRYSEYYNNAVLTSEPMVANTFWVASVMEAGAYRKEFMGAYTHELAYSMGAWGECAKRIGNDLKSWVIANAEQLRQRRQAK